jgi:poly(A) polymerase
MINDRELSKYTPAYNPVPSTVHPSQEKMDTVFMQFMESEVKLETDAEMRRRDEILAKVRDIFIAWVTHIAVNVLHLPEDVAEEAGGEIFISGSHKLGVRDVGADIDTVCVAPNFCTIDHFFTHLKEDLQKRSEVTELVAIPSAYVPLISFDFNGVSIDLLFARLASNQVPRNLDILDDDVLIGVDDKTEKSLNGPRVTQMIVRLVGADNFPNFLVVLRFIRKWAKKRGIYGNKLGYLGGVNCNILVAFICHLYPNRGPSFMLARFFKTYMNWNWPNPIMLNNIQPHPPGQLISEERIVWNKDENPNDIMPIITPAYPAMNSAYSTSVQSFYVMYQEISRGYEIIEKILRNKGWLNPDSWKELLEPTDFFTRYKHYLACHILGNGEDVESKGWIGFVEARIRRLPVILAQSFPLRAPVHLHPVVFKTQKSANSICYFIGFDVDVESFQAIGIPELNFDDTTSKFQELLIDPDKGFKAERAEGLDFIVEHLKWKELPKEVFETLGGYEEARSRRKAKLVQEKAEAEAQAALTAQESQTDGVDNKAAVLTNKKTSALSMFEQRLAAVDSNKPAIRAVKVAAVKQERKEFILPCLREFKEFGEDGLPTLSAIRRKIIEYHAAPEEELLASAKRSRVDDILEMREAQRRKVLGVEAPFSVPEVTWIMQDGK